jgi:hypothetical protein
MMEDKKKLTQGRKAAKTQQRIYQLGIAEFRAVGDKK